MVKVASSTTQHSHKPRILLLSDEYPPAGGGAGVIAKQVAHYLHRHHYPVTVISGDSGEKETEFPHILVKQQRLLWAMHYWNTLRQADTLEQYDVIILNDYLSAYLAGLCLPEHLLARCVMVVHGRDAFFYFHRQSKNTSFFNINVTTPVPLNIAKKSYMSVSTLKSSIYWICPMHSRR